MGNLGGEVTLKEGHDGKVRARATVYVTDKERNEEGQWVDAATTSYRLTVAGPAAEHLKAFQGANGNARVMFSGTLKSRTYFDNEQQKRRSNDVWVDEIGASLTFNDLIVSNCNAATVDNTVGDGEVSWSAARAPEAWIE